MKNIGEGGGERPPPLTGLDAVFARQLYANSHVPRTGFAITAYTLEVLFSSENPKELISEFLSTSLSEERFRALKERADRLHAVYLPKDEIPEITKERMEEYWQTDQLATQEFMRMLCGEPHDRNDDTPRTFETDTDRVLELLQTRTLPLEEVRDALSAVVAAFKEPEMKQILKEYKDFFKEEYWKKGLRRRQDEMQARQQELKNQTFSRAREHLELPTETARKVFEFLQSIN